MNKAILRLLALSLTVFGSIPPVYAAGSTTGALWLDKCARCHGDTGKGDTPLGKKLKVVDYSSKTAQEAFTDDYLKKLIIEGSKNGKTVMPGYKDELSDKDVEELTVYIRSLAKSK